MFSCLCSRLLCPHCFPVNHFSVLFYNQEMMSRQLCQSLNFMVNCWLVEEGFFSEVPHPCMHKYSEETLQNAPHSPCSFNHLKHTLTTPTPNPLPPDSWEAAERPERWASRVWKLSQAWMLRYKTCLYALVVDFMVYGGMWRRMIASRPQWERERYGDPHWRVWGWHQWTWESPSEPASAQSMRFHSCSPKGGNYFELK